MSQTTDILKSIPFSSRRAVQLAAALAAYFVIAFVLGPFEGLSAQGQCAIATMVAAVIVWVTGALPLAVAAMLMTMIQPLSGAAPLDKALTNFANPIVFFCFGMFCFTFAFTRTGFSERVARWISRLAGGNPARLLLCFIAGGTVLSAFMADVPVVVMLAPVALKVVEQNRCGVMSSNFAKALMIGLPIGVLMGGIATPTGASMNILTMQFLRDMAGVEINYLEWAAIGIPVALVLIPGVWFILLRLFPLEIDSLSDTECLEDAWKELGPMSRDERKFVVFILINVVLWCTDSLHHIPLPVLAVIGGAALFVPGVALIDWEYAAPRMGWDILMLIGGACSLSMSLWSSGAAAWMGDTLLGGLLGLPVWLLMLLIGFFAMWIHLLVPNSTAIIAVFMPMVIALAQSKGINPAVLALPLGFLASASLVLVIDAVQLVTYQYGYYSMRDWLKAGVTISFIWIPLCVASVLFVGGALGLY